MSIESALLGLGIALTVAGGIGTILALAEVLTMIERGSAAERKRAWIVFAVTYTALTIGVFLLGLTIPAVQQ